MHHRHESAHSQIERDERAVTRWLNSMEANLANPANQFSLDKFCQADREAIDKYVASHGESLGRYAQYLPQAQVSQNHLDFGPARQTV